MARRTKKAEAEEVTGVVEIPTAVTPAEAGGVRDLLTKALATDGPMRLALVGEERLSPCALQLAVSAKISAEAVEGTFEPDERLAALYETLKFQTVEEVGE